MVKYSNTAKQRIRAESYDSGSYLIGYDWILMVVAGILAGVMTTTMYQSVDPVVVDIAVYQMVSGIAGMVIGMFVLLRKPPTPDSDTTVGNLRVGFPTHVDKMNMLYYYMGGFVIVEAVTIATTGMMLSAFTADMNIAITAAVMEEALFGLALTTLFGSVFYYIFGKMSGVSAYTAVGRKLSGPVLLIAQVFACAFVGVLFVALHIGVYGTTNEALMFQIFFARFVYSFAFLRTRNISVPTLMHLTHNIAAVVGMF